VDPDDLSFIQNAGSVFVGEYSAQAAGDYASGPNHVLPTSGQARFRGGLSVADFVKVITVQQLSAEGMRKIGPAIECLAGAEGLPAHAYSVRVRCEHA
jgi:histidinol dehydrogenase